MYLTLQADSPISVKVADKDIRLQSPTTDASVLMADIDLSCTSAVHVISAVLIPPSVLPTPGRYCGKSLLAGVGTSGCVQNNLSSVNLYTPRTISVTAHHSLYLSPHRIEVLLCHRSDLKVGLKLCAKSDGSPQFGAAALNEHPWEATIQI